MLFKAKVLEKIGKGEVTLAFRRWTKPTVRAGGTLRTAAGVLAVGYRLSRRGRAFVKGDHQES